MKVQKYMHAAHLRYLRVAVLLCVCFWALAMAQTEPGITIRTDKMVYKKGDTAIVAITITIPARYHLYANPLGPGIGKPLLVVIDSSPDVTWFGLNKLPPEKFFPEIGEWVYAYENTTTLFLMGQIKKTSQKEIHAAARMNGLICATSCLPFSKDVPIALNIQDTPSSQALLFSPELVALFRQSLPMSFNESGITATTGIVTTRFMPNNSNPAIAQDAWPSVWDYEPKERSVKFNIFFAVLFGLIGGIILNFMPCVLPVLGIKIVSFSKGQASGKRKAIQKSLVFSAGIMSVFVLLAIFAAFLDYSWGQQFQNPKALIAIISIIFVFGLGLFDVFRIGVPSGIGALEQKTSHSFAADFFRGVFATILATPCSGPFLGGTLAWTLQQSTIVVFTVFVSVGVGMSLPYVALASSSRIAKIFPKPGKWMDDFKHAMGFLLFGFATYLMIGLPTDLVVKTVGLCVFIALTLGFYSRFAPFGSKFSRIAVVAFASLAIILLGLFLNFRVLKTGLEQLDSTTSVQADNAWQVFSKERLERAHADGKHVIVDFTANWCMNCQYNYYAVLTNREVLDAAVIKSVLLLKADITTTNADAESLLHHLGSRSVPFLAIFPGDAPYQPIIMRDIVSKRVLLKEIIRLADK